MKIKWILTILFISFFIVEITSQFTFNVIGDDQVYYYMGKLVAEGFTPYKDFFYAHPPLQLMLYGLFFKVFPYHFYTLKIIFIFLTIVNASLLFLLAKKEFNEQIALLVSIMASFAPTTLFNASFEYGLTIGMFFFLSALNTKRMTLKPILFGLSLFYRFHFIFLILGYYTYKFWIKKEYKQGLKLILFFIIMNIFLSITIPNYYQDTIYYHLHKSKDYLSNWITWTTIIKMNFPLFFLPLSFVLLWWNKINKQITKYMITPLPFMLFMAKGSLFGYYFTLIIPFLAVISSYFLLEVLKHRLGTMRLVLFLLAGIIVIGIFNYQNVYAIPLNLTIEPNRVITGDPPLSAYISLNQGNKVLNNDVDNNNMIYEEGLKNISNYIQDIKDTNSIVIARQGEGLYARVKKYRDFLLNECNLIRKKKEFIFFECYRYSSP